MAFILNRRIRDASETQAPRRAQNINQVLSAADEARDGRRWKEAAELYRQYLELRPEDTSIWVQLGHAFKESENSELAENAYRRAIALDDSNADTHLQLGHLFKLRGNIADAVAAYSVAHLRDPNLLDPVRELKDLGVDASDYAAGPTFVWEDELNVLIGALRDSEAVHYRLLRHPVFLFPAGRQTTFDEPASDPGQAVWVEADGRLSKVHQVDPGYGAEGVPLTWHMVQTYHRFDKSRDFHLNSSANRILYMVWYYYHFLPTRMVYGVSIPRDILHILNSQVQAAGPLTRFIFEIWRSEFRETPDYDIFAEEGYINFLTDLAGSVFPKKRVPQALFPEMVLAVINGRYCGDRNHPISKAERSIWRRSDVYRRKYKNIDDDWIARAAFAFDLIVHHLGNDDACQPVNPDHQRFWAGPIGPQFPQLSRFAAALATVSGRFGRRIGTAIGVARNAGTIAQWFRDEVVREFPSFSRYLPNPSAGAVLPQLRARLKALDVKYLPGDRPEEIELLAIGPIGAASGLGTGGRRSIEALDRMGCDYRIQEFFYDNPSAPVEVDSARSYRGERPRVVLWHFNAEYLPDVMSILSPFVAGAYQIGYFFWETELMPRAHALGAELLDEIWVPSEFVRSSYAATGKPVINVGTSVSLPDTGQYLDRDYFGFGDDFVFVFSFDAHSVIHRKNPGGVVRAFLRAFPQKSERVRLVLKTQNLHEAHWGAIKGRNEQLFELCASDQRIQIIDKTMSLHELYSLKNASDCYVSLHRSEGFGYGPAEAMALGKPVIMTNYSANTEFAKPDNCLLVDAALVPVEQGEYLYWTPGMVWADPDIGQAAAHMRRVFEDRPFALEMGRRGRESILRDFGCDAMARRYAARLSELGGSRQQRAAD